MRIPRFFGVVLLTDIKVSVDLIPNRRFIIYLLDFPSRLLADRLVHARLRRWMAWFSSAKKRL
jgi:hypothetical protein